MRKLAIGKGRQVRAGQDVAVLSLGHVGNYALQAAERLAAEGINMAVYDMRFAKPLDEELLHEVLRQFKYIITLEDGCLMGGFGSAVVEFMADQGYHNRAKRLGIPDEVIEHGTQLELHRQCGFDPEGIYQAALALLEAKPAAVK